jgi:hypothetical protein
LTKRSWISHGSHQAAERDNDDRYDEWQHPNKLRRDVESAVELEVILQSCGKAKK